MSVLLVYLSTLAPTVATNDAGRFQVAAPLLGTGHPTGYPTFILFGKLFTFLPFGDVAYRMNLMAAVFGAVAAALLYLVARELGARPLPAASAALLSAFSSTLWSQATLAEVYTMHASFLLGVAYLVLRWRRSRPGGAWLLACAGFVYGLSLGNNAGMALLAPAYLVLLVSGWRKLSARSVLGSAVAFLVGLSVYAYIPIRGFAGAWHNYGDPVNDWDDVWALVSGARFQGLMGASPAEMVTNAGDFAAELFSQAPHAFGTVLGAAMLAGGAYGAFVLFRRDPAAAAALVLAFACTLLYALNYLIDDIAVYYIPCYLVLYVLCAVVATRLAETTRLRTRLREAVLVLPLAAAVALAGLNHGSNDRTDYFEERDRSEQIFARLERNSVLYGKLPIVPMTYLSEVEGVRGDVALRWLEGATLSEHLEEDLESGRPVFFLSDPRYNEEYLEAVEPYAKASRREEGLIRFTPR